MNDTANTKQHSALVAGLLEIAEIFLTFIHSPKQIIALNVINFIEGMVYFGTLNYLTIFMHENVGFPDSSASFIVSLFLALVTLAQLILGGVSDKFGAKKMLGVALIVLIGSRFIFAFAEPSLGYLGSGMLSPMFMMAASGLFFTAMAYGLYQPAIYSITEKYSNKKNSSILFAMLYAGMNLGSFIAGLILPHIRKYYADLMNAGLPQDAPQNNGVAGSLIFLAILMVLTIVLYKIFISPKTKDDDTTAFTKETEDAEPAVKETKAHEDVQGSFLTRALNYIKHHPLIQDPKFTFFIFILLPVQTLFAYQSLLFPTYIKRCYTAYATIADNYETFSNLNPLIVFLAAPIIAALTSRTNVYKMMIIGCLVMAIPTFLLVITQNPFTLLTYVLIMSIGEALWQPRFLEHVATIAPKDKVAAYIGIAQLPWFLTKLIVGAYVGFFIEKYIPEAGAQDPETMWLIFALIAMISPVGLILARNWCNMSGDATKDPDLDDDDDDDDEDDDDEVEYIEVYEEYEEE